MIKIIKTYFLIPKVFNDGEEDEAMIIQRQGKMKIFTTKLCISAFI